MAKFLSFVIVLYVSSVCAAGSSTSRNLKWIQEIPEVKALNCKAFKDETYSSDYKKSELEVNKGIFKESPVFENGATTCVLSQNTARLEQPRVSVSEKAKLRDTQVEVYHSDGSGMIGSDYKDPDTWFSKCSSDPMTDEVRCSVYQKDIALVRTKNGYDIFVGDRNYPGSKAMFRSGKETPIEALDEASFSKEDTTKIIEQLSTGRPAVTRYIEWPNGNKQDKTLSTRNFLAAKEFLDKIYENHI